MACSSEARQRAKARRTTGRGRGGEPTATATTTRRTSATLNEPKPSQAKHISFFVVVLSVSADILSARREGSGRPRKSCRPSHATHHRVRPRPGRRRRRRRASFCSLLFFSFCSIKRNPLLRRAFSKACCKCNTGDFNGSITGEGGRPGVETRSLSVSGAGAAAAAHHPHHDSAVRGYSHTHT